MKKALFVSYVFPPMAAVGSQRVVNFCRFLPKYGWQPVVLTVKKGYNTSWDETMLEKIPDTVVYRTPVWEPYLKLSARQSGAKTSFQKKEPSLQTNTPHTPPKPSLLRRIKRFVTLFLRVPDEIIFWLPFALWRGIRLVKKEKIDAIISTSPPVSSHICASLIARFTGKPHVVDFRDLWTLNHTYHQRNYPPFFEKYDKWWENLVIKNAADILTASPGFTRHLQPTLDNGINVKTITNGFDYSEVDLDRPFENPPDKKMTILYTGSIYSDFNPEFFFEALGEWRQEKQVDPSTFSVDFYGNCGFDYSSWLTELGLEQSVTFHGFIPRDQLLKKIESARYLLLLLGFKDEYKRVIPAKLFDYLPTGIPILAIAPDGVTAELIKKYDAGWTQCRPDKDEMKKLIDQLYNNAITEKVTERKYRYIEQIDRNYLTGELAGILDSVNKENNSST